MHRILPFFFLFGSGLAALTYQMVWMRELRLVFGASTASTAAVSALFMAGLGLGGWLLGKKADTVRRPLYMYGILELAVAVLAAASPWLMLLCREYYLGTGGMSVLGTYGALGARLGLAAVVIGIPAFLMGGTLPAAVRAVTEESDGSRKNLGLLYGINTLGAFTGTVLATFYLLEMYGARITLFMAVGLNLLAAIGAILLAKSAGTSAQSSAETVNGTEKPAVLTASHGEDLQPEYMGKAAVREAGPQSVFPQRLVLAAAAGAGFAFFLMELVWYRMLSPVLGGSTYTFGLILAAALAGIGCGGAAWPLLAQSRRITSGMLAVTCLMEALAMLIPYAAGDRIPMAVAQAMPLSAMGFGGQVLIWSLTAMFVVFPAAFIAGLQFPLLIALLGQGSRNIGVQTGRAYALNTCGAIAGSLAGGFGLMPWLSAPVCWLLSAGILILLGVLIGLHAHRHEYSPSLIGESQPSSAACLVLFLIMLPLLLADGPTAAWRHSPVGAGRVPTGTDKNEIIRNFAQTRLGTYRETDGAESSVALINTDGLTFFINGKSDGNIYGDRGTQIMSAVITPALHPAPQRAMVVGLGTGCTAGWLSALDGMNQVDVVELEPAVLEMAVLCKDVNFDVVGKANSGQGVRIILNDAREVLSTIPEKYDIIVSEPSNPYRAGIASMYTREFYEAVRNRLAPGGLFHSWCQAYEIDASTAVTVMATLKSVFPYVECWFTQTGDLAFISSMEPIRPDWEAVSRRLEEPVYRDAMRIAWRKEGLEGFISHFIARSSFVDAMAAANSRGINTDDLMLVEYDYARTVGRQTTFSMSEVMNMARMQRQSVPEWVPRDINVEAIVVNFFLSWPLNDESVVIPPDIPRPLIQRLEALGQWQNGNFQAAAGLTDPDQLSHRIEFLAYADSLAQTGDSRALEFIPRFEDWWPAGGALVRSALAASVGNDEEAVAELEKAFTLMHDSPWEVSETLDRSFALLETLAARKPEYAPRLLAAIEEPLPLFRSELTRIMAMLSLSERIDARTMADILIKWVEPNPPWYGPVLYSRLECYRAVQSRYLGKAALDLETFNANVSPGLQDLFIRSQPGN